MKHIRAHWDDILRLAASIKQGTVTASPMLRKRDSYPRQNGLAVALRKLGRIERTLFALDWMQNVELCRRVQIGLNKGKAKNALARAVFLIRLGEIRDRSLKNRRYRASGLNLAVTAIAIWNTVYLERAVQALRESGEAVGQDGAKQRPRTRRRPVAGQAGSPRPGADRGRTDKAQAEIERLRKDKTEAEERAGKAEREAAELRGRPIERQLVGTVQPS